jgi:hypothetical protein
MMIIQTSLGETCTSPIVWLWTWQLWDSKPNYLIIFTHTYMDMKRQIELNWIQSIIKKIQFNLIWFELKSIKLWKESNSIWFEFNSIQPNPIQLNLN